MPTLISPGVAFSEIDLTTVVPAVDTTSCAFAGVFRWGPVDKVTLIDNESYLASRFGLPGNFNGETWFTAASYLAYSNKLFVVRAADVTGNTVAQSHSGNSTNLAIQNGTSTLQVANTSELSAGMILCYANSTAIANGAKIATVANGTHITLNKAATANVESISVIFRDDIAFTAAGLQSDLNYDIPDVGDWDAQVVKNDDHYSERESNGESFDTAALYVARYPADIGNSLKVSVCDTAAQYTSTTTLAVNAQINSTSSVLAGSVGSNTFTVTISPANTANATEDATANAWADAVRTIISTGDVLEIGNNTIGFQYLKITAKGSLGATDNVYSFSVTTDDELKLSGNVALTTLTRYWEYYNSVDTAPGISDYVLQNGNTSANDELHVVVVDENGKFSGSPGTILEVYRNLSRATNAKTAEGATNYYKDVINQQSNYVWWANDRTTAVSNTANFVTSSSATVPLSMSFVGGADGKNESNVAFGTLALAWDKFQDKEIDISLVIQGKARGLSATHYTQLGNYIIDNIAEKREDCVAFISPDYADVINNVGDESDDIVDFRNSLRSSSYGFLDSGYKYMYDKYNDVYRWVPLNGDIAGLCARTDATNDAWWSPAGLNRGQIKNVIRLAYNPRQAARDVLYKAGCNPVINEGNLGTYLNGDKTLLAKPSAFDRINVRRLFIVVEKAISEVSKYTLFEFNDDYTRAQYRNLINPYLRDIKGRRGIFEFLIVCDARNNTPEVIDRNEFRADIYIKPARSINFILLNFVAVRTGVSFSEVLLNQ